MKPVFDRYVALGDREIAGQSGLACQQVVVVLVQPVGVEVVADEEGSGFRVIERPEIHAEGASLRAGRALLEAVGEIAASGISPVECRNHLFNPASALGIGRCKLGKCVARPTDPVGHLVNRSIWWRQRLQQLRQPFKPGRRRIGQCSPWFQRVEVPPHAQPVVIGALQPQIDLVWIGFDVQLQRLGDEHPNLPPLFRTDFVQG